MWVGKEQFRANSIQPFSIIALLKFWAADVFACKGMLPL